MGASDDILARAAARQRDATRVLVGLELLARLRAVGEPVLVGAYAYELMVAPDIDIEVFARNPSAHEGLAALAPLVDVPGVTHLSFSNHLSDADQGLYFRLRYQEPGGPDWKVDCWLLPSDHPGPLSRNLVGPMRSALSADQRQTILTLKEALWEARDVFPPAERHSIDVYRAVLDDGVRTLDEFLAWRGRVPGDGLTAWRPRDA
jgi:hypothetical protein